MPGDLLQLSVGDIVPADVRLLETVELECDEAVLTGESMPVEKTAAAAFPRVIDRARSWERSCARAPAGRRRADRDADRCSDASPQASYPVRRSAFQVGLREFSILLVRVAGALTTMIFIINIALHRPFIEALLFSLAIAIGLTPQLLPRSSR